MTIQTELKAFVATEVLVYQKKPVADATEVPGRVFDFEMVNDPAATVHPVISSNNYPAEIKSLLKSATKSVYLQQPYALAGNGVKDLIKILAKKQGDDPDFDVRVISSAAFPEN